jgi:hypothetical protein
MVSAGANANGALVLSGGVQFVAFGTGSNTTVLNGGKEVVSGFFSEEHLAQINSGGLELVEGQGMLDSATISGGVIEIGDAGHAQAMSFATSGGGTLQLDVPANYDITRTSVSGFAQGDFIDFRGVAFSGSVLTWDQSSTSSGSLSVSNGAISANITLLGQYVAGNFTSASDGHGGTIVGEQPVGSQTGLLAQPHST